MVQADVFSTKIKLTHDAQNRTVVDLADPIETHYMHSVNVSSCFLLTSAMVATIAVMTYQISTQGIGTAHIKDEDYVLENSEIVHHPTVTLWNNAFLALVVWSHVVIIAIVCSPSSLHFLFMTFFFIAIAFYKILLPRSQIASQQSAGASSVFPVLLYICGMSYVAGNIAVDTHMRKAQTIAFLVMCDLLTTIVGHVWDSATTFGTVINCRILYLCLITVANLALYTTWTSFFKLRFEHAPPVNMFS